MPYIILNKESIESEHICCAFSDKKCADSYELKKQWLTSEFDYDYIFQRLDEIRLWMSFFIFLNPYGMSLV